MLFRFSCPHTSSQNGKAERKIRTINNMIRTLLSQASLPPSFWHHALETATYLLNILPKKTHKFLSPSTLLYNVLPTYTHLRVFGCLCYPTTPSTTINKLTNRSKPCVFLGYPSNHRGYKCFDISNNQIFISRHVQFEESIYPFSIQHSNTTLDYTFLSPPFNPLLWDNVHSSQPTVPPNAPHPTSLGPTPADPTPAGPTASHQSSPSPHQPSGTRTASPGPTPAPLEQTLSSPHSPPSAHPSDPEPNTQTPPHPSPQPTPPHLVPQQPPRTMRTRAMDGITKPKQLFNLNTTSIVPIPKTLHLALSTPEWYDAMQNDFSALIKNETWELVPRRSDMNIIRSMWLFKHKFRSDGSLERYKARLVCDGRRQQVGVDCGDTFCPVVKPTTIRTVLTLALSNSWPIHQLDVTNAFLHGHLQETVYMHQPMGFRHRDYPDHVCRLKKSLYGLKQAPRAWYQRFTDFVLQHGFTQCKTDNSLFIYYHDHDVAYLLIYVDDIILTTSSDQLRQRLMTILAGEFAMKDLGPLSYFLGISVTRTGDTLFLSQHAYAKDIIHRAGMDSCKPAATPVDTQSKLANEPDSLFDDPTTYRSLAGALQYLTFTRPDITYAVQQICMHMHSPCMAHWNALKRIIRYLQGTADYGLHLRSSSTLSIRAYTDADWAGFPNTRRSTSG
ncbi:hypothetical protein L6452_21808 [Arctium lappa]|uniref:Uncharacterized protein n=1 Tax=Arctium lappa TaxID=4217 RepID=A0ACB9AYT0_ARCLA|nr:hypothetical protein L6452_21808 [Arctium lappa]